LDAHLKLLLKIYQNIDSHPSIDQLLDSTNVLIAQLDDMDEKIKDIQEHQPSEPETIVADESQNLSNQVRGLIKSSGNSGAENSCREILRLTSDAALKLAQDAQKSLTNRQDKSKSRLPTFDKLPSMASLSNLKSMASFAFIPSAILESDTFDENLEQFERLFLEAKLLKSRRIFETCERNLKQNQ
jgi:hypothetical protein